MARANQQRGGKTPLEIAIQRINEMVGGELDLSNLDLRSLPPLPKGIRILNCVNNKLTDLPPLPDTLEGLFCEGNQLTTLPPLPDTLKHLFCSRNDLTDLPPLLHTTLEDLLCNRNQLTSLPDLPPRLIELQCNFNQLTSLPDLPPTLIVLFCENNQLTTLPALPGTLEVLECTSNQLRELPVLPPRLEELECASNPFIKPFQELIDSYQQGEIDLSTLNSNIKRLHAEIASLQSQGRNLQGVNLLRRQRWDPTKTTINMGNVLEGNVGSLVSSMLTGREGSTEQQMTLLRGNAARLNLPGTALTNIAKANALKKLQNQRKKGGSRKKTRKTKKSRKSKKE